MINLHSHTVQFESGDLLECYSLAGEYPRRGEEGEDTPPLPDLNNFNFS